MNLEVAFTIIYGSMGRNNEIFYFELITSWLFQVPAVVIAVQIKKDISSVYCGVSFGYFLACLLFFVFLMKSDWDHYAREAVKRVSKKQGEEKLLDKEVEVEMKDQKAIKSQKSDKYQAIN